MLRYVDVEVDVDDMFLFVDADVEAVGDIVGVCCSSLSSCCSPPDKIDVARF